MTPQWVILSSDESSSYVGFLEPVAARWNALGVRVFYCKICADVSDHSEPEATEYGKLWRCPDVGIVSTAFQSQVARLYATKFVDGFVVLSDIDMLPISRTFFNFPDRLANGIACVRNDLGYGGGTQVSMCYLAGDSGKLADALMVKPKTFSGFCHHVTFSAGTGWFADEIYATLHLPMSEAWLGILPGISLPRICRGNWAYDSALVREELYYDAHLPRPYAEHVDRIEALISLL